MTGSRKLMMVVLSFLMLSAVSVFAGTIQDLSKHLWAWSTMEEVLDETMPPISPKEAEETILKAQAEISIIIAGIKTSDEMLAARRIADEFVNMGEKQEEVGRALHRLLDRQGNFLEAHRQDNE